MAEIKTHTKSTINICDRLMIEIKAIQYQRKISQRYNSDAGYKIVASDDISVKPYKIKNTRNYNFKNAGNIIILYSKKKKNKQILNLIK